MRAVVRSFAVTVFPEWLRGLSWHSLFRGALGLLLALGFFGYNISHANLNETWAYGGDEGHELQKADFVAAGYRPMLDFWCDQPPLYSYLNAWVFKQFGREVGAARLLAVIFGGLLIVGFYCLVARVSGVGTATIAALLYAVSPLFNKLAVSVMLPVFAVSLSVWALNGLQAYFSRRKAWSALLFSVVVLAVGLYIKFTAALRVPGYLAYHLLLGKRRKEWRSNCIQVAILGILTVLFWLMIA